MAIQYNSNFDVTVPFSDVCFQLGLSANELQTITMPGTAINSYSLRFGYASDSNVFVCWNADATIPTPGSVTTQQYNEFKPGFDGSQRYAKGGDTISFITPDATAYAGVSVRQLPGI